MKKAMKFGCPALRFIVVQQVKILLKIFCSTFVPAKLLRFGCAYHYRQFGWSYHIFQVFKFPLFHLGPVTQVKIFSKCIAVPVAGIEDTGFSPYPCGAVKVDEMRPKIPSGLLHDKMKIQGKGLYPGKQGIVTVYMAPPGLYHSCTAIFKMRNGLK